MKLSSQVLRGLRLTSALWFLTVVVITLPMLGLARLVAPEQAEGSLLVRNGSVVGSRLIGQPFSTNRYLQGRPAGAPNLAPSNPELAARVGAASSRWQKAGIRNPAPDLLLDSGSGVDPHVSLTAARQQIPALARARGVSEQQLHALLREHQQGPWGGQSIEPVVNVLAFNLALDNLPGGSDAPPAP
ncbi:potassium-transporting ATPase subunit C [Cyanobium sp. FGCU-52]|nr:potassium-transporting ATPase subunit C [Cyanobium sp. FGCU52]